MRDPSLLEKRIQWEKENPRAETLVRAERCIVIALNAFGFGRQSQVTRQDGFDIAVDDLIISVRHEPQEDTNG